MDIERIQEIYEKEFEDYFNSGVKNEEIKGLMILAKYSEDVSITAEHDEIWAYLKDWTPMTEEDVRAMFYFNWRWDDENEGFAKFV